MQTKEKKLRFWMSYTHIPCRKIHMATNGMIKWAREKKIARKSEAVVHTNRNLTHAKYFFYKYDEFVVRNSTIDGTALNFLLNPEWDKRIFLSLFIKSSIMPHVGQIKSNRLTNDVTLNKVTMKWTLVNFSYYFLTRLTLKWIQLSYKISWNL